MSSRHARVIVFIGLMLLQLFSATLAHAGWSADPVQVHASAAHIPQVSAADDGRSGAIVVWNEDSPTGGLLRARHLLASGDVDPSWPTVTVVSARDMARRALGAIPDGSGGAYVWWIELVGPNLYLTRITSAGTVAPGWSALGRFVATLIRSEGPVVARSDRAGGIVLASLGGPQFPLTGDRVYVRAQRIGPTGAPASGWGTSGRTFASAQYSAQSIAMDVSVAGDVWLAWNTAEVGPAGVPFPGEYRAARLRSNGQLAAGWNAEGVLLGTFDTAFTPSWLPSFVQHVAIASDGGEGAFVVKQQVESAGDQTGVTRNRLVHVDGAGSPVAPIGDGLTLRDVFAGLYDPGQAASPRAIADGRGGVYIGLAEFATDVPAAMLFDRLGGDGLVIGDAIRGDQAGLETALRTDGGLFVATFKPSGASSLWDTDAYVAVRQSNGPGFLFSQRAYSGVRFGDVGLTSTTDGGAILAWSEELDRHGVFAVRLGAAGQVTDVPPVAIGPRLRAHFTRGRGVIAQVAIPGALEADLALLDVQGRIQSTLRTASNSTVEAAFPGTAALSPGIYFVRSIGAGQQLTQRVVVLR